MSVAEKLKALDWDDGAFVVKGVGTERLHNALALRNALPQIVAVVELAEENAIQPMYAEYPQQGELFVALAALDEALS